ncbi:PTS fructose transporter subunit IIB [Salinigranum marinum]|uniref:PTS fructose transporter subunit IIB n=1 Tax=Salinigranum marinum TaxID=1515595 RepID=UPI003CCE26FB
MKIVAVTACPTGIAHSQMAAENVKTTAEARGHEIRVEVQGAMGAQDELTTEEIAAADVVVITADTAVSQDRFAGKPVVKKTVKDGVNKAEAVIREAERLVDEADAETVEESPEGGDATGADPTESADIDAEADGVDDADEDRSGGLLSTLKRRFS